MKFMQIVSVSVLLLSTFTSSAETLTFESENAFLGYNHIYPTLDLNGDTEVELRIEKKNIENTPESEFEITKVVFKFEHANNLTVNNFSKVAGTNDIYRAIVTSPWVFKKLMVEVRAIQFSHLENIEFRVFVVENYSDINNIETMPGVDLIGGSITLIDVSPTKVVDVVKLKYLDKPLTLSLLDKTLEGIVQIKAVWMGHGTKILSMNAPTFPNLKPIAIFSETQADGQYIKVRLDDGFSGVESQYENLYYLLEREFGPLPQQN